MAGQRAEKKPGGVPKAGIIAGAVIAVLAAAYLGLCAWVGASDRIMPNVSVAGVDVSGMTAEQARAALEQAVAEDGAQIAVTLRQGSWSGTLTAADLGISWDSAAETALDVGRGSFLTQGAAYLTQLVGMSDPIDVPRDGDGPVLDGLLEQADQAAGSVTQASYAVEGDQLSMTKGVTGVVIDRTLAKEAVLDAMAECFQRKFDQGETGAVSAEVELPVTETPPREPDFNAIHQEVYVEPKDAAMDPETYEITDHVVGVDFDIDALKSAYEAAEEGAVFTIPLTLTQPKETKESLNSKLFADLLGEATTTVSGTANRKNNVKLSAGACNGVILLPGEVFSYNTTTGTRSADKGYLPAPVYSGGASVDEVGGGICQTSSTIYYAVLHTALEIVERRNHMYNTSYVDPGMDATVYFGSIDFQFKNSTDYPIKIVTQSYDSGGVRKLTVKIYGTNEKGIYAVPKSTTYDVVPPTTQYKADESVPRGTTRVDTKQNAYTGLKAQTYRYIYDKDGTLLETQNMGVSTYKSRPKTILYNPADGDPATWPDGVPPTPSAAEPAKPAETAPAETDPGTAAVPEAPDPAVEEPTGEDAENAEEGTEQETGVAESEPAD